GATTGLIRPRLSAAVLQALLPARGPFTFPAPYNTSAVRITNASDCGGGDCVDAVGYSYWRNINNHVGSDQMLIFLGLNRARGGVGPSLFSYNKLTGQVASLGPLFDPSARLSWHSTEGWYWSMSKPTKIYVDDYSKTTRYDVNTHQYETVFDVAPQFGADKIVWQMHSSDDDKVHSATLRTNTTYEMLGCVVYHEDTRVFQYFPKIGDFNECSVDKSGRWLMSLEDVDYKYDLEMRIFNLATGAERLVWDQDGAVGHADMGYDYVKQPKGNLDLTGQYFIWTSNVGGSRLDAFVVKIPSQVLMGGSTDSTPPTVSLTAPAGGATVGGPVNVAASASDNVAVAGVQF